MTKVIYVLVDFPSSSSSHSHPSTSLHINSRIFVYFFYMSIISILYIYLFFSMCHIARVCQPQDVTLHLKAGSYPVISPENITFPKHFLSAEQRLVLIYDMLLLT